MTVVEYGGGGHRTRLRDDQLDQLVCLEVPLVPVYKGAKGRRRPARERRAKGVLLPLGVGLLLFLVGVGEGEGRGRRRRKEGAGPLYPKPI